MKVFKENCQLHIARGLREEDRGDFVAGAGQGHLQGKGFGPTVKDGEQVHILHVFSKNNMSISFCDDRLIFLGSSPNLVLIAIDLAHSVVAISNSIKQPFHQPFTRCWM